MFFFKIITKIQYFIQFSRIRLLCYVKKPYISYIIRKTATLSITLKCDGYNYNMDLFNFLFIKLKMKIEI